MNQVKLRRFMKSPLDMALVGLFFLSVVLMFLANEDSFARDSLCNLTRHLCFESAHAESWNKVLYDLSAGSSISLIFYVLIVRIPEFKKRVRIKKSLAAHYQSFKRDCIEIFLLVADGSYTSGVPDALLEQRNFERVFPAEDICVAGKVACIRQQFGYPPSPNSAYTDASVPR